MKLFHRNPYVNISRYSDKVKCFQGCIFPGQTVFYNQGEKSIMTVSAEGQQIWSVGEINRAVRDLVENSFMPLWISGEVGSLVVHNSGHVYMTLKDSNSQLRGCWFGGAAQCRQLGVANGSVIEAFGNLTVYEVRGEYQFAMKKVRLAGVGTLQRKFEELKHKLQAEGLFESSRKKAIPSLPRTIGVITSPDGAALRDFLQIIRRRNPHVAIKIYPATVQGENTAGDVIAGIDFFNNFSPVDVLVVTRGGGSMEDLWGFNDEKLARCVAASRIPVISAVGHEIDFTICDFVSDLRVPTPSAAAELVSASYEDVIKHLERLQKDLKFAVKSQLDGAKLHLQRLLAGRWLTDPLRLLSDKRQYIDELTSAMERSALSFLRERREISAKLDSTLAALNPRRQLERGYAMVTDAVSGKLVKSSLDVSANAAMDIIFADGKVRVVPDSRQDNKNGLSD